MNLVAIVGRPNVGKSTLFNRLIGHKTAIIADTPGVTRDRIYGKSDWNGIFFEVVDTGGFIPGSENTMERAIREQAMIAVEEADAIIFLTDAKEGVTPFDIDIANILRTSGKPIILVANKCDNHILDANAYEFYTLGLGEPFPISSTNGHNTGDFLDELVDHLKNSEEEDDDERLKVAFVGRPNVGKSSLTNAIIGHERMIVTDIAGTTRDSVDSVIKYFGEEIVLIDTAGLRRRSQIKENIELYSIIRTARAIDRCDVAVVLLDATRGLEEQDKKIINQVADARKGIIVAMNKWDIFESKEEDSAKKIRNQYQEEMRTIDYVPFIFISALTKQRVHKIMELAKEIKAKRQSRISTSKLNSVMIPLFKMTPPPAIKGRDMKINYMTQTGTEPPIFAFFCNFPELLPSAYKRFMERKLREEFDLEGAPVSFVFRKKNKNYFEKL